MWDVTRLLLVIETFPIIILMLLTPSSKFKSFSKEFFPFLERDDHVKGIQRGCIIVPDDISEGDCKDGDIFGRNGTICYCKENDCNKGDVTPPTPELSCLNCFIEEDCFSNPDVDGVSSKCIAPENTGCYKALIGEREMIIIKIIIINYNYI